MPQLLLVITGLGALAWTVRALLVQVRGTEIMVFRRYRRMADKARKNRVTTSADADSERRLADAWKRLLEAAVLRRLGRPKATLAALDTSIATWHQEMETIVERRNIAARAVSERREAAGKVERPTARRAGVALFAVFALAEVVGLLVVLEGLDVDPLKARLIAPGGAAALLWLPKWIGSVLQRRAERAATDILAVPWSRGLQALLVLAVAAVVSLVVAMITGRAYDLSQDAALSGYAVSWPTLILVTLGLTVGPAVSSAVLGAATSSPAHRALAHANSELRGATRAERQLRRRISGGERKAAALRATIENRMSVVRLQMAAVDDLHAGVIVAGCQSSPVVVRPLDEVLPHLPGWGRDADVIPLRPVDAPGDETKEA